MWIDRQRGQRGRTLSKENPGEKPRGRKREEEKSGSKNNSGEKQSREEKLKREHCGFDRKMGEQHCRSLGNGGCTEIERHGGWRALREYFHSIRTAQGVVGLR